jgi:hypothetical protein
MPFSESLKADLRRRSDMRCCICQNIGVEIHHIIPEAESGPDTEENAAPLCPSCHETYGANPTKRKFIREARDNWLEACARQVSAFEKGLSKLIELASKGITAGDLTAFRQELLSDLSKILRSSKDHGEWKGQPLGQILAFLYDLRSDPQVTPKKDIEALYKIIKGFPPNDKPNDDVVAEEFGEVKNQFIETFGHETARRLWAYGLSQRPYNIFRDVFTEEDVWNLLRALMIMMIPLLQHEEIAPPDKVKLEIAIENDGGISARILMNRSEAKQE